MPTRRTTHCFASVLAVFLLIGSLAACAKSASVSQDVEPETRAIPDNVEPAVDADTGTQDVEPPSDPVDVEPQPDVVADAIAAADAAADADDSADASSVRVAQDSGPVTSLREVDFENGFTYVVGVNGLQSATVTDGEFRNGDRDDADFFSFWVQNVEYGDLDGDGQEEVAVSWVINTGGSGNFSSLEAFRLVDGQVESVGKVPYGDRAHGGIFDIMVEDGIVRVWSFGSSGGACCPTEIFESRAVLGLTELVLVETLPALALVQLNEYQDEVPELKFLPGASAGAFTIDSATGTGHIIVEAAAGQTLAVRALLGGQPTGVSARNVATGEVTNSQSDRAEIQLPDDAVYEIFVALAQSIIGPDQSLLTVTITNANADTAPPVSWIPQLEQTVVSSDPALGSYVAWPQLVSDHPGTAAANERLRDFATGLDDLWLDAVRADDAPTSDNGVEGTYEATYRVSVVGDGIVSVRFDYYEYLCCLPHPNNGPIGIVFDLVNGEEVLASDIVDLSRRAELNEIWFDALANDADSFVDATLLDTIAEPAAVTFDAVTVVPGGIELATGRGSLVGVSPGTTTVLAFRSLGDLLQPEFAVRLGQR